MKDLTMILSERLGLLLVLAFVLTRIPGFRSLLYREYNGTMSIIHACMFGIFGMAGTIIGVIMDGNAVISRDFVWHVEDGQMVVSSSLVAIVIAGLLGGPVVGLGAGLIAGAHLFVLGGVGFLANSLVNPLTGLLAGLTARFFSQERVISPFKALFIGVFPPVLHMQLLLLFDAHPDDMITTVNKIGLPMVLSNSIAIAIFTAMIGIVLREQESEAALATKRALTIAEEALPFLKIDDARGMAKGIANLLYDRLKLAAVSVTNEREVLAHTGLGADHHCEGDPLVTVLAQKAIHTKKMQIAYTQLEIQCENKNCPLEAAIIIPIIGANDAIQLIKFYFKKAQHIRPVEITLAKGLGQLISNLQHTIATEQLKLHIRDAELRNLQAQINPHFLFNTLHLIAALFRRDPDKARHITVQLAQYMRFNLSLVSSSLVHLEKECAHVKAYMEIIQARFSNRLQIHFSHPEELTQVLIPPATIQPLVENCVQHGLKQVTEGGLVEVLIQKCGSDIQIIVRDNGCGFPENLLEYAGQIPLAEHQDGGTGLYNVNQRLVRLLGEKASLHIHNLSTNGSEVFFMVPCEMKH